MSRWTLTLVSDAIRKRAVRWIETAADGTRVEFKEATRSSEQNALLWATLTDVARQVEWHGMRLSPEDWKLIFMDALGAEMRLVPNLDTNGFINLGRSSSALTKAEM